MNRPDKDLLKASVDCRDVVRFFRGEPHHRTPRYDQHLAGWRQEDTASLTIYANSWKDYGEHGSSGDVFSFIQREMNISFKEAVEWLNTFNGGQAHPVEVKRDPRSATNEPPSADWQRTVLTEVIDRAAAYLWSGAADAQKILHYLRKSRHLHDDTIRAARLGYNPDWFDLTLGDEAIPVQPGIVIPCFSDSALWTVSIRSRVGEVAEVLGIKPDRLRGEEIKKYRSLRGSKSGWLYGGDTIIPGQDVLVVEGQFDALLATQETGIPTVTLGAASNPMTSRRREQLQIAGRVLIAMDSDTAGQGASTDHAAAMGYDKTWLVALPAKDITDVIRAGEDLNTIIVGAVPAMPPEHRQVDSQDAAAAAPLAQLPDQVGAWYQRGLPDSFRRALNRYFEPTTSSLIELLIEACRAGIINPERWTIKDLIAANLALGFGIPASTLRRVMDTHTGDNAFFSFPAVGDSFPTTEFEKNSVGRKAQTFKVNDLAVWVDYIITYAAPRIPEKAYGLDILAPVTARMLTEVEGHEAQAVAAILQQLYTDAGIFDADARTRADKKAINDYRALLRDLADLHSTPLPAGWRLGDPRLYRAAFTRAIVRGGERHSRAALSRLIGVPESAVPAIMKLAGFEGIPQAESQQVNNIGSAKQYARQQRGKLRRLTSYSPGGESKALEYFDDASASQFIEAETGRGATVFAQVQVANLYSIIRDTPAEITRKPAPEIEPEPAYDLYGTGSGHSALQISSSPAAEIKPTGKHYGPTYDPAWIYAQLRLALKLLKSQRYQWRDDDLVDRETGELIETPTARQLIDLLLDRQGRTEARDYDAGGITLLKLAAELGAEIRVVEAYA